MTTLKLKAPNPLPADGVNAVAFKVWKNGTIAYIEQELDNHLFFTEGIYNTWSAKNDGLRRIRELVEADPLRARAVRDNQGQGEAEVAARQEAVNQVLLRRNVQLTRLLQHIANVCHYSEQDDIINNSTSIAWVWTYLETHYNIQTRGSKFLDIAAISPKADENPMTFYKQVRARVRDNLRKTGDRLPYRDNVELREDETFSPSFESFIVMYVLKELDARLPEKVQKDYGHRMQGNTHVIDLAAEIFQQVPHMIIELDQMADLKAMATPGLNAFRAVGRGRGGGSGGARGGAGGRGGRQGAGQGRGRLTGGGNKKEKFCRICKAMGKSETTFKSHYIGACPELMARDKEDFIASLTVISTEEEKRDGEDEEEDESTEQEED